MKFFTTIASVAGFLVANYFAYCITFDAALVNPYASGLGHDFFVVFGVFRINAGWLFGYHQVVPWIFLIVGPILELFGAFGSWWKRGLCLFLILLIWDLGASIFADHLFQINAPLGAKLTSISSGAFAVAFIAFGGFGTAAMAKRVLEENQWGVPASGKKRPRSHYGFTLIELLAVIGIVAVLSAILFPVLAKSKERANLTVDISNMKQLYTAMVLYEDDSGSPLSLIQVQPYVKSEAVFRSPSDPLTHPIRADYPADIYETDSPNRSAYRVSYGYLHSLIWDNTPYDGYRGGEYVKNNFEKWRADPTFGIIGVGFYNPIIQGDHFTLPYAEHDHFRIVTKLYRLNMDGSLYIRRLGGPFILPGGLFMFNNYEFGR